ncbi:MAG: hypothetical protein AAB570_03620 [Patescibacteria group bacterium]
MKEIRSHTITFLIYAFAGIVVVLLFSQLRFVLPPHFTITSASDAFLDARSRTEAKEGHRVFQGSTIVTRDDALVMGYEDIRLVLQPHVTMRVQNISQENVSVLATRGTFFVEPGTSKDVQVCTRQVCVQATSPVMVNYITPGEIVHVRTTGTVNITYNQRTHPLRAEDELVIDELAKTTVLNGAVIEW